MSRATTVTINLATPGKPAGKRASAWTQGTTHAVWLDDAAVTIFCISAETAEALAAALNAAAGRLLPKVNAAPEEPAAPPAAEG